MFIGHIGRLCFAILLMANAQELPLLGQLAPLPPVPSLLRVCLLHKRPPHYYRSAGTDQGLNTLGRPVYACVRAPLQPVQARGPVHTYDESRVCTLGELLKDIAPHEHGSVGHGIIGNKTYRGTYRQLA